MYDGTYWVWIAHGMDNNTTYSNASLGQGYGTCATAADTVAKIVTLSSYSLVTNGVVAVKFTYAVPASATMNINSKGAKAIYYRGSAISAGYLAANRTYTFRYNGTQYEVVGDIDTNTYDRLRHTGTIKCSTTPIVSGNLIVGSGGLYQHLKLGKAFDITYPILYAASAISASGTGNNNYKAIHITITTTQSITLSAYKPVYIKGKLSGTIFTPVSTTPITQEVPTSEDDYQYILLGLASSTTTFYLLTENPVYEYRDEAFEMYTPTRSANLICNEDDLMLNSVEGYSVDATLIKAINSKINGIEFQIVDGKLQYRYDEEVWG